MEQKQPIRDDEPETMRLQESRGDFDPSGRVTVLKVDSKNLVSPLRGVSKDSYVYEGSGYVKSYDPTCLTGDPGEPSVSPVFQVYLFK